MPYNPQFLQFNIKNRLKQRNVTVKQMCIDLDVNINVVNQIDKRVPSIATVVAIADYLECTVDDLLKQPFT